MLAKLLEILFTLLEQAKDIKESSPAHYIYKSVILVACSILVPLSLYTSLANHSNITMLKETSDMQQADNSRVVQTVVDTVHAKLSTSDAVRSADFDAVKRRLQELDAQNKTLMLKLEELTKKPEEKPPVVVRRRRR